MGNSPRMFAGLMRNSVPNIDNPNAFLNLTFFTGAGFSKSWDSKFPVGDDLFSFKYSEWSAYRGPLSEFLSLNNQPYDLDLSASMFKDIVYQISMMRKYPVTRPRYIDDRNLDMVERHLRYLVRAKFEKIAPLYFQENGKITQPKAFSKSQKDIQEFFKTVGRLGDGSDGTPEGLRANYVSTNYDYVLEMILDSCLGGQDSYSIYTYRGITPSAYSGEPPITGVHNNWLVSNLFKINGGFEIFREGDDFEFEYRNTRPDEALRKNPPQLMLASREQDYTQDYFHAMFPKVVRLLQESHVLVIVGYSMPEEDALLRLIIKQFAEDRADGVRKILFYVDMMSEDVQLDKIYSVFPHARDESGLTVVPYSGPFGEWCKDVIQEFKK